MGLRYVLRSLIGAASGDHMKRLIGCLERYVEKNTAVVRSQNERIRQIMTLQDELDTAVKRLQADNVTLKTNVEALRADRAATKAQLADVLAKLNSGDLAGSTQAVQAAIAALNTEATGIEAVSQAVASDLAPSASSTAPTEPPPTTSDAPPSDQPAQ